MRKFCIFLVILFLLASCSTPTSQQNKTQKIISLSPNITEIVYFLGAGDRMIGRTSYCNYPPEVSKVESVGDPLNLKIERIIELKPDIVLVNRLVQIEVINKLRQANLNVETFDPQTIYDVLDTIDKIANLLGSPKKSRLLLTDLEKYHKQVSEKNSLLVYVEIWDNPPTTFGKTSLGADMVRWIGAKNLGDMLIGDFPTISNEAIVDLNPDYLIIPESYNKKPEDLNKRVGFTNLKAVKNKKILIMKDDILMRAGPRILEAIKQLTHFLEK